MPSSRPSAAFEPISPSFDVRALVESQPNFEWVVRIHADMIEEKGMEAFEKLVLIHVILHGKPVVVEGYDAQLDRWTFAQQWLKDNHGTKVEHARDLTKKANVPLTIGHYLNNMAVLTNQWTDNNYKDPSRQRMYLKDIDCPPIWANKLRDLLPPALFYLNESTGDPGGFGSVTEADPDRPGSKRQGRGIAKAGDLMSSLPPEMRAENLMCYIGHEGTYTPAHREMCASLGQNIMVEASTGLVEAGQLTKPGSSLWFMTESKDREVVSEYWLSRLGHDIEVENHFAQINAWKNAPFKVHVVEQRPGDFILIPPLAPHQVWNRGTRTMKVAWNRTTIETLEMALSEALPRTRMVCRDEQYKNKAIVYYTLQKYSKLLSNATKFNQKTTGPAQANNSLETVKVRQLEKDFRRLHALFTQILVSESFFPNQPEKGNVERLEYDSNITCSYCRCNIFNRFLTCPHCVEKSPDGEEGGDDDTYDICMECYAMGRSCACISKLKWVEQWPWADLTRKHELWRHQILAAEGKSSDASSPLSLKAELELLGNKRTLAQVCQSELAKRPFCDIQKPAPVVDPRNGDLEREVVVDESGHAKKKKYKKQTDKFLRQHARCHVDCHWEPRWKQAGCATCDKRYCFGTLYRGYDEQPQDILANPDWQCPSCRKICNCRNCKHKPGFTLYTPSSTILGHNTKIIADPRSVESLVDFSYSNIGWIQKAGDDNGDDTLRLKNRQLAASAAKEYDQQNPDSLGENYVDSQAETGRTGGDAEGNDTDTPVPADGIPIDPSLMAGDLSGMNHANGVNGINGDHHEDEDSDAFDANPEGAKGASSEGVDQPAGYPVIPTGGVIRDMDHAYDATEAITYDYPDPDMSANVAVSAGDEQVATPSDTSSVPDAERIEMVNRKRKRQSNDEGSRKFANKRGIARKATGKNPGKSLVVTVAIAKEKLAALDTVANGVGQSLDGAAPAGAPVIRSDLQALNVAEGGQARDKRGRGEPPVDEEERGDDEFTPTRHRDRRKGRKDGVPLADPDAHIDRRQTRKHEIHYRGLSTGNTSEEDDDQRGEEEQEEPAKEPSMPPVRASRDPQVVRLGDFADFDGTVDDDSLAGSPAVDPSSSQKPTVRPTAPAVNSRTPQPPLSKPTVIVKMSATAWGDSDSEDDELAVRTPVVAPKQPGFTAINGGSRAAPWPVPKRGRPPGKKKKVDG